jgi:hypothetical protein
VQLEAQKYLRLVETANAIGFVDIEAQNLKGDYGSTLVVSILPYRGKCKTLRVTTPGRDRKVVREAKAILDDLGLWVTYYGKGFDVPFLNTRLLRWGLKPLEKRHHCDLYFLLRYATTTARHSQGHLLSWLQLPEQKMTVSADAWTSPKLHMDTLVKRCESDVRGLKSLYERTKHLVGELTR